MKNLILLGMIVVLSGCATMTSGTTQKIDVKSSQSMECVVTRKDKEIIKFTAPEEITVSRSQHPLVFKCGSVTKTVNAVYNNVGYANALVGGLVGMAVDAASGAYASYPRTVVLK